MGQKSDRGFRILISDGAVGFDPLAGFKSRSLKINNERIDATLPDVTTPEGIEWKASLDGTKSISVSGDGRLLKAAGESQLTTIAMSQGATEGFQIVVPNVGTFAGEFTVTGLEFGGDGGMTFSATFESEGEITFTAEA